MCSTVATSNSHVSWRNKRVPNRKRSATQGVCQWHLQGLRNQLLTPDRQIPLQGRTRLQNTVRRSCHHSHQTPHMNGRSGKGANHQQRWIISFSDGKNEEWKPDQPRNPIATSPKITNSKMSKFYLRQSWSRKKMQLLPCPPPIRSSRESRGSRDLVGSVLGVRFISNNRRPGLRNEWSCPTVFPLWFGWPLIGGYHLKCCILCKSHPRPIGRCFVRGEGQSVANYTIYS